MIYRILFGFREKRKKINEAYRDLLVFRLGLAEIFLTIIVYWKLL